MASNILFPDVFPPLQFEGDCFIFPVVVNGKRVKVSITAEALQRRLGARSNSRQDLELALTLDMPGIQSLTRSFIEAGRVSANGDLVIRGADVMKVSFGEKLSRWRSGELLARQATRRLEEAIGEAAPRVSAMWDLAEDERGHAVISLELTDEAESIQAQFEPWELEKDSIRIQLRFIRLWGDLLQKKSHRQLQELLAS